MVSRTELPKLHDSGRFLTRRLAIRGTEWKGTGKYKYPTIQYEAELERRGIYWPTLLRGHALDFFSYKPFYWVDQRYEGSGLIRATIVGPLGDLEAGIQSLVRYGSGVVAVIRRNNVRINWKQAIRSPHLQFIESQALNHGLNIIRVFDFLNRSYPDRDQTKFMKAPLSLTNIQCYNRDF